MEQQTQQAQQPQAPQAAERKLVSIMRACIIAGVSRRTIYNWLKAGKLTPYTTVSGATRIDASELVQERVIYTPRPRPANRKSGTSAMGGAYTGVGE